MIKGIENEVEDFLDAMIANIERNRKGGGFVGGHISSKTKLYKTGKEARVNARLDSMLKGQGFDESLIPEKELETKEEDMSDVIVERLISDIIGE
jgi:hypothetical protein